MEFKFQRRRSRIQSYIAIIRKLHGEKDEVCMLLHITIPWRVHQLLDRFLLPKPVVDLR